MKYCNNCHVTVRGTKTKCDLCGSTLSQIEGPDDNFVFPEIPLQFERHVTLRILVLISIAAIVISFTVRMIFPTTVNWPLFVLFGLISIWASLSMIIRKRHNIPKTIVWQVSIVSVLAILWDWQTDWRGWSFDYVIPAVFILAIIIMYITGKITKLKISDYIFYALISGFFGIIPALFILCKFPTILFPSLICVASSIIFLAALFIFHGKDIRKELNKRMHL